MIPDQKQIKEAAEQVRNNGAEIEDFVSYDPFVKVDGVNQVESLKKLMDGADCAIIATDHAIFSAMDFPADMIVVDGRNMLNRKVTDGNYYGLGRGRRNWN